MTFDKTKAMRNAERYLSQGKIRSAIGEYEQVVKYDSKDFGTINMLGDLYSKNTDVTAAIRCYTAVADHYGKQGFAQKAIAIYNKISRLDPDSVDVWLKLAELHKQKGSLSEARTHYKRVADQYEKVDRKLDALAIWKEIALLDPANTESYLSLAESYQAEGQREEAHDAFFEAGKRFAKKGSHDKAVGCFQRSIAIKRGDVKVLEELVHSQCELGRPGDAAEHLKELLGEFPHSREIRFLLVECLIKAGDVHEAEQVTIRLVEMEPANYPKFLELARIYVDKVDLSSATRILSMSSEHMLVGGQAEEFNALVEAVIEREPDHLEAWRLKARYCSWQRDEAALCDALAKLAQVGREAGSVEDERLALIQLSMLRPQEPEFAERLRDINQAHGFEDREDENLFDKRFSKVVSKQTVKHKDEWVRPDEAQPVMPVSFDMPEPGDVVDVAASDFAFVDVSIEADTEPAVPTEPRNEKETDNTDRLEKEIDGVRFYIENGYLELAEKAATELREEFGDTKEIVELLDRIRGINGNTPEIDNSSETDQSSVPETTVESEPDDETAVPAEEAVVEPKGYDIADLRTELGLEDSSNTAAADFETHFNTATAYQEMGLIEDSIREYQSAIALVQVNDGTRRFFACANLLGHCFMQQGMPKLALTWFERTLETADLSMEEKLGIWYELGAAHEADGDSEAASQYFEQVYAEDVNFRNVSERIKSSVVSR
ncbi:MAG TPA: tetratricopeptide repeat protein [Pyrinomonadaceae bacterium]|nr:tetratricopeptide repeat protein [Pyrinomonadaceae bacterium]